MEAPLPAPWRALFPLGYPDGAVGDKGFRRRDSFNSRDVFPRLLLPPPLSYLSVSSYARPRGRAGGNWTKIRRKEGVRYRAQVMKGGQTYLASMPPGL